MIRRPARALLVVLALASPLAGAQSATSPRERQDLDALRSRLERLKQDMAKTEDSRAEASDQLKGADEAISRADKALREVTRRQAAVRAELRGLEDEARRLEADGAKGEEALARLIRERYLGGDRDFARLVLSGDDPNRIARDVHYLGYVSRAQAELIRAAQARAEDLRRLAERTRAKSAELAALGNEQQAARAKLESERRARVSLVERLSDQLRLQRREISTLERDERRLAELVERLARLMRERAEKERAEKERAEKERQRSAQEARRRDLSRNDKIPEVPEKRGVFSSGGARVGVPVKGEVVARFGAPRADGGPSWKGVLIRSTPGQEVKAVAGGTVVFAEWMRGFGNLVIVDHGSGYMSIYGNNEALLRQPGDRVRTGDSIATVGASGGVEQPGLYFEVRHHGRPVDPAAWIGR